MSSSGRRAGGGIELGQALERLRREFGVAPETVLQEVREAVAEALVEAGDEHEDVDVRLNSEDGRLEVLGRPVGPGGTGPKSPLALTPAIAGRAARLARVRLARGLRESRLTQLEGEAGGQVGQLVDALVERRRGNTWLLRAGRLQAYLDADQQIPGESLEGQRHLKVVLLEPRRGGPELVEVRCSRTSPLLLRRLLELEVPEVAAGTVRVRAISREPGIRAKVAVESTRPEVDAKGACIGPRGARIRTVVGELAGEEVDVVEWAEDPAEFVARALAPASVLRVEVDQAGRRALATVTPAMLSLAIGKGGRNARLAAHLTGWRIGIRASDGT